MSAYYNGVNKLKQEWACQVGKGETTTHFINLILLSLVCRKKTTYKDSPHCDCNGAFSLQLQTMMVIKRGIHVITSLNDLPVCSPQCSLKKGFHPLYLTDWENSQIFKAFPNTIKMGSVQILGDGGILISEVRQHHREYVLPVYQNGILFD